MNKVQAKKIISGLAKEWRLRKIKPLLEVVDSLDKGTNKKLSFSNEFEFSVVEAERNIRLLHLNFWQPHLSAKKIRAVIDERERTIILIFKILNHRFSSNFNRPLAQKIFEFNRQSGCWPIQFGLECQKGGHLKLKIYLSINKDKFPLKNFCRDFNLDYKILRRFQNKKFDTIAIDFLKDSNYDFKFYPLIALNRGLLYRVDKNSRIMSVKQWLRIPEGITVRGLRDINFFELPNFVEEIISVNKFRIFYLCQENNKKSLYFR